VEPPSRPNARADPVPVPALRPRRHGAPTLGRRVAADKESVHGVDRGVNPERWSTGRLGGSEPPGRSNRAERGVGGSWQDSALVSAVRVHRYPAPAGVKPANSEKSVESVLDALLGLVRRFLDVALGLLRGALRLVGAPLGLGAAVAGGAAGALLHPLV